MIKDKKALQRDILILALVIIAGGIIILLGFGICSLLGTNEAYIPLSRYLSNAISSFGITWWIWSAFLLIALRFPIAGLVLVVYSIVSFSIPNIPNYLIYSRVGLFNNIIVLLLVPLLVPVAILLTIILFKVSKKRWISYFIPLVYLSLSYLPFHFSSYILSHFLFPVFFVIGAAPFFLEMGLQKLFLKKQLFMTKTQDMNWN